MAENNSILNGLSMTWGCFAASVFLLLYHEKVFFDEYFKTVIDYGMVLGLTVGVFLLIAILGTRIPGKFISGLLWGVLLATAVLWILLGSALPMEPSDIGCLEPICQVPGQLALIILELGIAPPLLLENFRRSRQSRFQSMGVNAGLWAGFGLLGAGLLSLAGYYWTYLANVGLSILTAIGVLMMTLRNIPAQVKAEDGIKGINLYVGQFLRDFAMLAFVGVFGFSIMERDTYSFELLIPFGIGFLVFAVVFRHVTQQWGELQAMKLLEGVVVGTLVLILGFMIYMIYSNETVVLPMTLPPWMVGFAGAYLWHRMNMIASGKNMRFQERERHFLKIPLRLIREIVFMFFLTGLFLLTAVNIDPDGTDSVLILDLGFVIGIVHFLVRILYLQMKSSEPTPIPTT